MERSYAKSAGAAHDVSHFSRISSSVSQHRIRLRQVSRRLLESPSLTPEGKFGVISIMDSLLDAAYAGGRCNSRQMLDFDDRFENIPSLVDDLRAIGHVGSAIYTQENYLNCLDSTTSEDTWRNEFQRYCDLHQEFRSQFMSSNIANYSPLIYPPHACLPFMESLPILPAVAQYFPSRNAVDLFGRTILHLVLYKGVYDNDIINRGLSEQYVAFNDSFGRTPLQIAGAIGLQAVLQFLQAARSDLDAIEVSKHLTELALVATAKHEILMKFALIETFSMTSGSDKQELIAHIPPASAAVSTNQPEHTVRLVREQLEVFQNGPSRMPFGHEKSIEHCLHYYSRYNHELLVASNREVVSTTEEMIARLQTRSGQPSDEFTYLRSASQTLLLCRHTLKWTHAFTIYLAENDYREIREDSQKDLERAVGTLLDMCLEPHHDIMLRVNMMDKTAYCRVRRHRIFEDICAGFVDGTSCLFLIVSAILIYLAGSWTFDPHLILGGFSLITAQNLSGFGHTEQ